MSELDWSDKRVLVVGLGKSGFASAMFLADRGARVTVIDKLEKPLYSQGMKRLEDEGVELLLGTEAPGDLGRFELLVVSPAVPPESPVLVEAARRRIPVWSEIELGFRTLKNCMVAVTGTNGKTTTTELVASMLERGGREARVCGNIGNPLVGVHGRVGAGTVLVVEVSSFQLENIDRFRPELGVLLNIAPDHFDWHPDFDEYRAAKARLVENQLPGDSFIYSYDDKFCREVAEAAPSRTFAFSTEEVLEEGIWLEGGRIVARDVGVAGKLDLAETGDILLPGKHYMRDVMAAAGAALLLGVDRSSIVDAISGFRGLEHRMEFVAEVGGVAFYNDSKATNPHAAMGAMESFDRPKAIILGGRNKGLDFSELVRNTCSQILEGGVKGVVLYGEASEELEHAFTGICDPATEGAILKADGLEEAVGRAMDICDTGGMVLFSPGCSSFDQYNDYRERGRVFKNAVMELMRGRAR